MRYDRRLESPDQAVLGKVLIAEAYTTPNFNRLAVYSYNVVREKFVKSMWKKREIF